MIGITKLVPCSKSVGLAFPTSQQGNPHQISRICNDENMKMEFLFILAIFVSDNTYFDNHLNNGRITYLNLSRKRGKTQFNIRFYKMCRKEEDWPYWI